MKPGFIILAIIGIILALAVFKTTGDAVVNVFGTNRDAPTVQRSTNSRPDSSETLVINANVSSFSEKVELRRGRATDDEPREEYIEIRADNDNGTPISITGWSIKSLISGHKIAIGNAAKLPIYPGNNIQNDPVILEPGDRAYIISGPSPIRLSFRTNVCTGYFEENKDFVPRLSRQCPDPEDENLERYGLDNNPSNNSRDEDCLREIKSIGRCINPGSVDDELSRTCRNFIDMINYNWCASLHLTDSDFAGDEWYVYVGSKFNDIWDDDNDTIELRDTADRLVDVLEY